MTEAAMSPAEHGSLTEELARLEGEGRREIAERIKTAREWGDLKENAEYHDAKNAQAMLETRIAKLRERLLNANVIEETASDGSVGFGSTVTVRDDQTGREQTYTLVGSSEANAARGKLSSDSPVAKALQGLRAGDAAKVSTPKGERTFQVLEVS
jgi:transcription elongation factor GreA